MRPPLHRVSGSMSAPRRLPAPLGLPGVIYALFSTCSDVTTGSEPFGPHQWHLPSNLAGTAGRREAGTQAHLELTNHRLGLRKWLRTTRRLQMAEARDTPRLAVLFRSPCLGSCQQIQGPVTPLADPVPPRTLFKTKPKSPSSPRNSLLNLPWGLLSSPLANAFHIVI